MRPALIQAFAALRQGETVPFSRFPSDWTEEMLLEGGVASIVRGSRKSLRVISRAAFDVYLRSKGLQPDKLEETVAVLSGADSRASQVQLLGDSKAVTVRSCPGFPVNVTGPLSVRLGERKILLCPCPGSFLYISDFLRFRIPSNAIVVGVENMENFRFPEREVAMWEQIQDQFGGNGVSPLLLVSRYPQSRDLVTWLQEIPNEYVHFGDFDLAGIHIYLTEFYRYLGAARSNFFIPEDIEKRLSMGSTERYQKQFGRFGKMEVPDTRLLPLVSLIHRYQKGYDQEGYIEQAY
ncbi:MAG: hypothetical protein IJ651_10020 [Bacteroidales bacterium]|nr:hypothetical protein [Bacteroidales bacterium]MBR1571054.1 hypothetical protein [Bacteroidales bacterium]